MALVIDVEQFCILKARVGGHRQEKCPQCKALKAAITDVNNQTLDMIEEVFRKTEPDLTFTAKEIAKRIHDLKTV
jgi:phage FluMu protein Com